MKKRKMLCARLSGALRLKHPPLGGFREGAKRRKQPQIFILRPRNHEVSTAAASFLISKLKFQIQEA
jgi:hypothetical protein